MPETLFKKVDYSLTKLLHDIDHGDIGLPDIQRPFVWSASKVRDLFDSMYRGFPVGYLLFWANDNVKGVKTIGTERKQHTAPRLLIVDGQQRLTSLYAVLKGQSVLDDEYRPTSIRIAFHPLTETFEVADAAMRKDPTYIPDISSLWAAGKNSYKVVTEYLTRVEESRALTAEEEEHVPRAIDRLYDLQNYPFTAMEISGSVDEEKVADIFVRINSKGVQLRQSDFILTLLSVFWDEGRRDLEMFSRNAKQVPEGKPSPFNHVFQPDPDQLLRVDVALGFKRAVMKNVYSVLRGKDMETGGFSSFKRDEQFAVLTAAQEKVLNLTYWHDFLKSIAHAGYRSKSMITSKNSLVYAYAMYLIGRVQCAMDHKALRRLIARWFFASAVGERFSGSFETLMEDELGRLREGLTRETFVDELERTIRLTLTEDFWRVTLPDALESSGARTPSLFAYYAALCVMKSNGLFSELTVWELFDPSVQSKKANMDRHHLFPKAYLRKQVTKDKKLINQIANTTLMEWPDNIKISATSPAEYVPKMRERFSTEQWRSMAADHALPDGWTELPYDEFLARRRVLMAGVIRRAFESL